MLVTDTSGSMNATDVEPVAPGRGQARPGSASSTACPDELQVGLVAYADGPHTVLRPTQDREQVAGRRWTALRAEGGTATGDALERALATLGDRGSDKPPAAIVLLSDGATKTGRGPAEVAREARAAGVPIYTVALGTADGAVTGPDGQSLPVPPDPEALAEVAQISGGRAFAAEDADALDEVYETLGSRIGTSRRSARSARASPPPACSCWPGRGHVAALARPAAVTGGEATPRPSGGAAGARARRRA